MMRAVRGVKVMVSAITAFISEGPRAAASAMASSTPGKAISPSITRISPLSSQRT